jgi:hypothetical protein
MQSNWTSALHCALMLVFLSFNFQCTSDEVIQEMTDPEISAKAVSNCGCTYTIPPSSNSISVDAQALGLGPGSVICLQGGATYKNIYFKNLKGSATNKITIRNCGAPATINATGTPYGIATILSSYFRITGDVSSPHGIKIIGGEMSLKLDYLTTNVEVDNIEIANSSYAGIMAKTDPSCDNATIRGNFVMKDIKIHHNYIHDTQSEAMYIGHSYWINGLNTSCGVRYPHAIEGLKIYNNTIKNSGAESIQIGSTPTGATVYNNRIENYGARNIQYHNNGVQFGEGATGTFYKNRIKGGSGIGLIIIGNGQNFAHDNVFIDTGGDAIFCDDRVTGSGFKFINNTIINPKANGITLYADQVTMNEISNNIIVNPGSLGKLSYPRSTNDSYLYFLNSSVKRIVRNNYVTNDIASLKFYNPAGYNYSLTKASPVIDKGADISSLGITTDYYGKPRLKGASYDIGASEFQP